MRGFLTLLLAALRSVSSSWGRSLMVATASSWRRSMPQAWCGTVLAALERIALLLHREQWVQKVSPDCRGELGPADTNKGAHKTPTCASRSDDMAMHAKSLRPRPSRPCLLRVHRSTTGGARGAPAGGTARAIDDFVEAARTADGEPWQALARTTSRRHEQPSSPLRCRCRRRRR